MKRLRAVRDCRLGSAAFVVACLVLSSCLRSPVRAADAGDDYARAIAAGKRNDLSAAFMHFRPLTERASPYREASLFAVGEYYVLKNVRADAIKVLATLIREYPASRYRVFALWYLMMMAEKIGNTDLVREYQQHIIMMRQHSFLFRESKEWEVISPLQRKLKVVYYIDKVEFYVDGDPRAVLSY